MGGESEDGGQWRERRAELLPRPEAGGGTRGRTPQTPVVIETWTRLQSVVCRLCIVAALLAGSPGGFFFLFCDSVDGWRKMSNVNWKPFVFGGLASVTAECGKGCVQRRGGRAARTTANDLKPGCDS